MVALPLCDFELIHRYELQAVDAPSPIILLVYTKYSIVRFAMKLSRCVQLLRAD